MYDRPWGGGNLFLQAFCAQAQMRGHHIVYSFDGMIDVAFVQDPRPSSDVGISIDDVIDYKISHPSMKIVHRVNECDARKGTNMMDALLRQTSEVADVSIFVSGWMREYHTSSPAYLGGRHHVIYNGVNHDHFKPFDGIRECDRPVRLITHHWSDNVMKGKDVYEALDLFIGRSPGRFEFTYVGRHQCDFKHTRVLSSLYGQRLGDELRQHDVYVSGSRFDPGPNHIIESISCGLPTYVHRNGGGCVEFVGEDHVFNSVDELFELLTLGQFVKNTFVPTTWEQCMSQYFRVIEELM